MREIEIITIDNGFTYRILVNRRALLTISADELHVLTHVAMIADGQRQGLHLRTDVNSEAENVVLAALDLLLRRAALRETDLENRSEIIAMRAKLRDEVTR